MSRNETPETSRPPLPPGSGAPAESAGEAPAVITVELVRGLVGVPRVQREVVRGLGLRRIGSRVTRSDTGMTRGMVRRVAHLVRVGTPPEPHAGKESAADVSRSRTPSEVFREPS